MNFTKLVKRAVCTGIAALFLFSTAAMAASGPVYIIGTHAYNSSDIAANANLKSTFIQDVNTQGIANLVIDTGSGVAANYNAFMATDTAHNLGYNDLVTYAQAHTATIPAGTMTQNPDGTTAAYPYAGQGGNTTGGGITTGTAIAVSSASVVDATHVKVVFSAAVTQANANAITMAYGTTPIAITSATLSQTTVANDTVTLLVPAMSVGASYALTIPVATNQTVTYSAATLTVAADSTMPAATTVLRGSTANPVFAIKLSASAASAVQVTSINIAKTSASVFNNGEMNFKIANPNVSTDTSVAQTNFDANGKLDFNLATWTGGGLTIPAGGSVTLTVTGDSTLANAVPSHAVTLYVQSSADITANATSGNGTTVQFTGIPVYGNAITNSASAAASVATFVADAAMPAAATVTNATGTYVPVYAFDVTANSISNLYLNTIKLVNLGSLVAGTDNTQYKLQYLAANGTWTDVATYTCNALTSGKLVFTSAAAANEIAAGTTVKYQVVTDVVNAATTGKTVQLSLISSSDLTITDNATVATGLADTLPTVTVTTPIAGNTFTTSNPADNYATTFAAPATQVASASNIVATGAGNYFNIMSFTLTNNGTTDTSVTDFKVKLNTASGYYNHTNSGSYNQSDLQFEVKDQFGTVVEALAQPTSATSDTYDFATALTVPYGTSRTYTVVGDFNNATAARWEDSNGNLLKIGASVAKSDITLGGGSPTLAGTTTVTSNDQNLKLGGTATVSFNGSPLTLAGATLSGVPAGGQYIGGQLTITADSTENLNLAPTSQILVNITGQSATNKVSIQKVYLASDTNKTDLIAGPINAGASGTNTAVTLAIPAALQTGGTYVIPKSTSATLVFVLAANKVNDATTLETAGQNLRLNILGTPGALANMWFTDGTYTAGHSTLTGAVSGAQVLPTNASQTLTSTAVTVTPALTMTFAVSDIYAANATVAANTQKAEIAKITYTNPGTEDINVNQVTLTPGAGATLAGADGNYVLLDSDGSTVLASGAMNTTTAVTFGTANTKTFTVPAGGTKVVYFAANMAAGATATDTSDVITCTSVAAGAVNVAVQGATTLAQLVPTTATPGTTDKTTYKITDADVGATAVAVDNTTLAAGGHSAGTSVPVAAFTLTAANNVSSFNTITISNLKQGDTYSLKDSNGNILASATAGATDTVFTLTTPYTIGSAAASKFTVNGPLAVGQSIQGTVKVNTVLNGSTTPGTNASTVLQAIIGQ